MVLIKIYLHISNIFEYIEWKQTNPSRDDARDERDEIGRALISQQHPLSDSSKLIMLRSTRADPTRVAGADEVGTNITTLQNKPSTISNTENGTNDASRQDDLVLNLVSNTLNSIPF